jgi:hypothetical protein
MLPPRSKRYVGHDGRIPREKTLTILELSVGSIVLLALLVLMFPRDSLVSRVLEANPQDALTHAYLVNLLKIEPDNQQLLALAAQQQRFIRQQAYANLSWQKLYHDYHTQLTNSDPSQRSVLLGVWLDKMRFVPPSDERNSRLRELLPFAQGLDWIEDQQKMLIDLSFLASERELAQKMLNEWLMSKPANPLTWLDYEAKLLLGQGHYQDSAYLRFIAMGQTNNVQEQKSLFLEGLKTLMAGGFYQQTMDAIDSYAGNLIDDEDVLRSLLRFSQAAGQQQRARRYAKLLLEMK